MGPEDIQTKKKLSSDLCWFCKWIIERGKTSLIASECNGRQYWWALDASEQTKGIINKKGRLFLCMENDKVFQCITALAMSM